MNEVYIIIEHCNGEIMSEPIVVIGTNKIFKYTKGEYLIYQIIFPSLEVLPIN